MDDKLGKFGTPLVAVAAMPNQKLGQVVKLLDGEVGRKTGLPPFLADDTNSDIGCLDH